MGIHVIEQTAATKKCQISPLAWKMLVVYYCVHLLMLHNSLSQLQQLITTPIYYLTTVLKVRGPGRQNRAVTAWAVTWTHGEGSTYRLIQVDGRVQFPVLVGLRSVSLLARSRAHSQLPEASHIPSAVAPSSKTVMVHQVPVMLPSL